MIEGWPYESLTTSVNHKSQLGLSETLGNQENHTTLAIRTDAEGRLKEYTQKSHLILQE